ncbi:hypothetical protein ACLHTV_31935, partial [Pseudomonas aeruginosa]
AARQENHGAAPTSCSGSKRRSLNSLKNCLDRWVHFRLLGSAPTEVLIQAPNALVLGFFDHYLRGRANDFPQAQMARFPAWLTRYDNSAVRDWWLAKPEAQRLALRQRIDEMKRRKTGLDLL